MPPRIHPTTAPPADPSRKATTGRYDGTPTVRGTLRTLAQISALYSVGVAYDGASDYRNDAGEFLRGTEFSPERFVPPEGWDHYHCECCNAKFMTGSDALAVDPHLQREGYTATLDSGNGPVVYWVCQECFDDLARPFSWTAS